MMRSAPWLAIVTTIGLCHPLFAAEPALEFRPDPVSVQRFGSAFRYPQAGWIVLHIEGEPYQRGEQHGRLLAPEIVDYVRACAAEYGSKAPEQTWRVMRTMVNALFVRQFETEYLEEMKGIADGAAAAGAKFDGRPIDLIDIVALNCWPEIESLDDAVEALPTGLEGKRFPGNQPKRMPATNEGHCSAFVATGPATADGKIVFGHITMWNIRLARFFHVWLDVQSAKGHRVLMQSFPGGIQSGTDYYMNSNGLLVTETTLRQTRFDGKGLALAGRIRKVLQYANSIDEAVEMLKTANNGLYTNEWLLADTKTNEIAMFELGTHHSHLYRSSKNEWFGGTEGFYWGCNNTKDMQVRLETIPGVEGRPQNMVWWPHDRDKTWLRLYSENKGKITGDFARLAFTTPPLAAIHSLDAKYTTSAMAKRMETWALFGSPTGNKWEPTKEEREKYPNVRAMPSNPWTWLRPEPPPEKSAVVAVDLHDRVQAESTDDDAETYTTPAWNGTILPNASGDAWLAAGFAEYERIVALEIALKKKSEGKLTKADLDLLAVKLNAFRSQYLAAARRAGNDTPLSKIQLEPSGTGYAIATGKGVVVLNELRSAMGSEKFCDAMDSFGRANAGKEVTTAQFVEHVEKAAGGDLDRFFHHWLEKMWLPNSTIYEFSGSDNDGNHAGSGTEKLPPYRITGRIGQPWGPRRDVDVTLITTKGEQTKTATYRGQSQFVFEGNGKPQRIVVDPHNRVAKLEGSPYTIQSFDDERDQVIVVYGTRDEEVGNRAAAEVIRETIRTHWSNVTVPIKADRDVSDEELKNHHLLLVGRPDSNRVIEKTRDALPVKFGPRSFAVRGETYAHTGSAVLMATDNPFNNRYSAVVIAGLGVEATARAAGAIYHKAGEGADVIIMPNVGKTKAFVAPARDLVYELNGK